jgi:oxidoreductase, FAD-dependent
MIHEYNVRVLPQQAHNEEAIANYIARDKGINRKNIKKVRVLKRSIDARQRTIFVNLSLRVYVNELPSDEEFEYTQYNDVSHKPAVIVVGEGPAGLFASLRLIEKGFRPIVLERGKSVNERKKDIALIATTQVVDEESNYSFGEGGAGAFSDGKLYTRSKKRGSVSKILNVLCQHGASTSILVDAHPHIGTDKLPVVIENMRKTIERCGGQVLFQTKMTSLLYNNNVVEGVKAIDLKTANEKIFKGAVILATGHSARDVYRYLHDDGIEMEAKGIAVGVRLEHQAELIDQIQYHNKEGRGLYLPAAEYSFVTQVKERGVYSFCMCPGGFVIPAATGPSQVVVNGMSPSNRGSKWSNSGMVVETRPEDIAGDDVLKMMKFQEEIEQNCWQQGNRKQTAPAQRMVDFVNKKLSFDLPKSSYKPGLISSPLHFWMPEHVVSRLQEGFKKFGKMSRGFLTNDALMIAAETRTSSPVRILREKETLQHVRIAGLFPCGEGAGYAGGIVSAAMDGEKCADMCAEYLS